MSYYEHTFVSPEPLYAEIKEELRSYFESNAVDDTLFTRWTDQCLKKLGKSVRKVSETVTSVTDFQAKLPSDFYSVKEAWLCTDISKSYTLPNATYESTTYRITPEGDVSCECPDKCDVCVPTKRVITTKTTNTAVMTFSVSMLLRAGKVSMDPNCSLKCTNHIWGSSSCIDEFEVRDNQLVTNFREGNIYLIYYSDALDENFYQLIPSEIYVQEYIKKYIIYKLFNQLYNQATDESFNQLERKYITFKQEADEALILARNEERKWTDDKRAQMRVKTRNRLNEFKID